MLDYLTAVATVTVADTAGGGTRCRPVGGCPFHHTRPGCRLHIVRIPYPERPDARELHAKDELPAFEATPDALRAPSRRRKMRKQQRSAALLTAVLLTVGAPLATSGVLGATTAHADEDRTDSP